MKMARIKSIPKLSLYDVHIFEEEINLSHPDNYYDKTLHSTMSVLAKSINILKRH